MKVIAVIQARMGSTRLPGKVLMDLGGRPVLGWVVEACEAAAGIDRVVVATSTNPKDDEVFKFCQEHGIYVVRGSEEDVISRFMDVMRAHDGDAFVRITADEPFMDHTVLEQVVGVFRQQKVDYCSNVHPRTYPDGLDVEVFSAKALILANQYATRTIDRECVTSWMVRHPEKITETNVYNHLEDMKGERWVLDTEDDYNFCCSVADLIGYNAPTQMRILEILATYPHIREINSCWGINERFFDALDQEPVDAKKELEGFLVAGSNKEIVDTIDNLIELRIEEHARNNSGAFR
jgi:spore coat polysaccharide biosynthesis protein SpsF (cytidylyltransferase family)